MINTLAVIDGVIVFWLIALSTWLALWLFDRFTRPLNAGCWDFAPLRYSQADLNLANLEVFRERRQRSAACPQAAFLAAPATEPIYHGGLTGTGCKSPLGVFRDPVDAVFPPAKWPGSIDAEGNWICPPTPLPKQMAYHRDADGHWFAVAEDC
jgi:hypothetical protein